ncbi:MAG: AMP-binding acetyl-CoA synthetase [Burkholderiales bacterium PBB4]|nr:MAG: AMP-binding acetyl-CoA synthetase [Burkholderiales bacterium PBB4]
MTESVHVTPQDLPLARLVKWEQERAHDIYLTQPMGQGQLQDITWQQAADQVRRVAQWLLQPNIPAGSRIGILGKNSAHWILSDLAIGMAGHVSVPIYPTFNAQALAYIFQHSEAKACFVGKMDDIEALRTAATSGMPLIALPLAPALQAQKWDDIVAQTSRLEAAPSIDPQSISTIIYTSGTTGVPKGVVHTYQSMAWGVTSATRRVTMGSQDRLISYLPLAHVAERMLIEQASLRYGIHVFFAESLDTFVQDLQRARPTIFFSVPRLWVKFQQGVHAKLPAPKLQRLLRIPLLGRFIRKKILKGLGLDQCRIAAGGAAPMPGDVLQWYRELGLDLIEVYGMTENSGVSHSTLPGSTGLGTVGLPHAGVESRIDATTGEIQMRCGALMQGYYREPGLTAEVFTQDGWLRTGDKGQLDPQGALRITGRVKDIFKTSKGKYVAPAPIEDLLVLHPDIEACAVTGANLAQPFAVVMLSLDAAKRCAANSEKASLLASLESHLKWVNGKLEPHEKLDCLAVTTTQWTPENGFVTPTMKVKRTRIEESFGGQYASWVAQRKSVVWADAE